jgi:hypothetical protein
LGLSLVMRLSCPSFCAIAVLSAGLAACAPLPGGLDRLPVDSAAAPALLPLEDILSQAQAPGSDPGAGLAARAARLKARAALMRGPVHDPATRARLAEAIRQGRA